MKNSKSKLDTTELELRNELKTLRESNQIGSIDSMKIKLLSAIVIRQDEHIENMASTIESLKKELRRPNIFIDGILENENEKTPKERIQIINDFLKEQMEIEDEISIKQAYRIGVKVPKTFKVVLNNPDDKPLIFEHVSNLKEKRNARRKLYFVSKDLTELEKEKKEYYRDLIKANTELPEKDRLQIKLRKGRIYANKKHITSQIAAPRACDILTLEEDELQTLHKVKTHEAATHQEGNSDFYCHYQKVHNENDVESGLAKMKIKYGDATHIVTAYRLQGANGPFSQGYLDDNEGGAGRVVLKELQSKDVDGLAIYVVRYYGGKHLGSRRFEIYGHLASKAIRSFHNKMERLMRSNRLRRSGSQLSQLSQSSINSQEFESAPDEDLLDGEDAKQMETQE